MPSQVSDNSYGPKRNSYVPNQTLWTRSKSKDNLGSEIFQVMVSTDNLKKIVLHTWFWSTFAKETSEKVTDAMMKLGGTYSEKINH